MPKSSGKSSGKPFTKDDARINRTRPGPGRPPDAFKELCRQLAAGEKSIKQVRAILANADHGQFMAALRWATENGYGKPTERMELSGPDGGPVDVRQSVVIGGREIVF